SRSHVHSYSERLGRWRASSNPAFLESFTIHTRALLQFFHPSGSDAADVLAGIVKLARIRSITPQGLAFRERDDADIVWPDKGLSLQLDNACAGTGFRRRVGHVTASPMRSAPRDCVRPERGSETEAEQVRALPDGSYATTASDREQGLT